MWWKQEAAVHGFSSIEVTTGWKARGKAYACLIRETYNYVECEDSQPASFWYAHSSIIWLLA